MGYTTVKHKKECVFFSFKFESLYSYLFTLKLNSFDIYCNIYFYFHWSILKLRHNYKQNMIYKRTVYYFAIWESSINEYYTFSTETEILMFSLTEYVISYLFYSPYSS